MGIVGPLIGAGTQLASGVLDQTVFQPKETRRLRSAAVGQTDQINKALDELLNVDYGQYGGQSNSSSFSVNPNGGFTAFRAPPTPSTPFKPAPPSFTGGDRRRRRDGFRGTASGLPSFERTAPTLERTATLRETNASDIAPSNTVGLRAQALRELGGAGRALNANLAARGLGNSGLGIAATSSLIGDSLAGLASQIDQSDFARSSAVLQDRRARDLARFSGDQQADLASFNAQTQQGLANQQADIQSALALLADTRQRDLSGQQIQAQQLLAALADNRLRELAALEASQNPNFGAAATPASGK